MGRRSTSGAARDNDVDKLVALTAPDVDWRPTAVTSGALHGHEALRDYLDGLAASGALVDAHPYSFEVLGDCVIVSGALRLRRENGAIESVRRWWVYRVTDGRSPRPPATPAATMHASTRGRSTWTSARTAARSTRR